MTNALLGYMIGKFSSDHGGYADMNEMILQGFSSSDFDTPEVKRYLAIQQFIASQDLTDEQLFTHHLKQMKGMKGDQPAEDTSNMNKDSERKEHIEFLQNKLVNLLSSLPEFELPFYFLPVAYLKGATFEEVVNLTARVVILLTSHENTIEQVMSLVAIIKWSLTTNSSYFHFINRCFPNIFEVTPSASNLIGQVLATELSYRQAGGARSKVEGELIMQSACEEPDHAAVRCALTYALAELRPSREYTPNDAVGAECTTSMSKRYRPLIYEDFSVPFPLKSRLSTHVDAHIVDGYYRLDGYVAWKMNPKNEPLLAVSILGDTGGPDRETLRFWNFCNKHAHWEELAQQVDAYIQTRPQLSRSDWRELLRGYEIQWYRNRVALTLSTKSAISFIPNYKKKCFELDASEVRKAIAREETNNFFYSSNTTSILF